MKKTSKLMLKKIEWQKLFGTQVNGACKKYTIPISWISLAKGSGLESDTVRALSNNKLDEHMLKYIKINAIRKIFQNLNDIIEKEEAKLKNKNNYQRAIKTTINESPKTPIILEHPDQIDPNVRLLCPVNKIVIRRLMNGELYLSPEGSASIQLSKETFPDIGKGEYLDVKLISVLIAKAEPRNIREEVGSACYESWDVGARIAIERLEKQIQELKGNKQ